MSSEVAGKLHPTGVEPRRGLGTSSLSAWVSPSWAVPVLLACSLALFAINTRHGIGIFPDSTRYMGINDRPYDAPLYAWLVRFVALPSFIGIIEAATIVGVALVALNTFLMWRLIALLTKSNVAALLGTALLIFSPQFVGQHATAMSEPFFITFIFASFLAFREWLVRQQTFWLIATAVLVALCSLVRFTGPPLGAAIALTLLLQGEKPFRTKLAEAALFTLIAASIFFAWLVGSEIAMGHSTGRDLTFDGNTGASEWVMARKTLAAWLLPQNAPRPVRALITPLVLGAGYILVIRNALTDLFARERGKADPAAMVIIAIAIFIPLYFAFCVVATKIEANLVINSRYAFPAYAATILLFTCAASRFLRETKSSFALPLILVFALGLLSSDLLRTSLRSYSAYRQGIGFQSLEWKRSPTLLALQKLPSNATLFSNGPDAISVVLGRTAHFIPRKVDPRTEKPDPDAPYGAQLLAMQRQLHREGGYVVFLDRVNWRPYLGTEDEIVRAIPLQRIATTGDGRIYQTVTSK